MAKVVAAASAETDLDVLSPAAESYLNSFREALENDLGTPRALSALQGAVKDNTLSARERQILIEKMDSVLSLGLIEEAQAQNAAVSSAVAENGADDEIQKLIDERTEAKKAKNFARADEIRNQLASQGIILTDTPTGTVWKKA